MHFCFCCRSVLSHVRLLATPWTAASQASLSFTISQSLLELMSIELVMLSNLLILCHPLLLLPSVFPSIRVFSNELALRIRQPKYWSFSFTISPSDEYSGLISFRIDWFDLFANCANLEGFLPITFIWFPAISRLPVLCYLPPTYPLEMVEWWNVLFNHLPGTKSKGKRCVCSWM